MKGWIFIAVYTMLDIMYIINCNCVIHTLSGTDDIRKRHLFLVPVQMIFSAYSAYGIYNDIASPFIIFCFLSSYVLLFLINILLEHKHLFAVYCTSLIITIDSAIQSIEGIIIRLISGEPNNLFVLKTVTLAVNVIFLLIVMPIIRVKKNSVRNAVILITKKIYLLMLLFFFLLDQIYAAIQSSALSSSFMDSSFILSVLLLLPFIMALLAMLCKSQISRQYYQSQSQIMEKQLKDQLAYYDNINESITAFKRFRHDHQNHMQCLRALLYSQQYEKAEEYINSITPTDHTEIFLFNTGNSIVNAILTNKNHDLSLLGGKICFSGCICNDLPVSEICTIIFNAVDNSIEAISQLSDEREKVIKINCFFDKGIQVINISNPSPQNADISTTWKKDKADHGFGLSNIRQAVEKEGGEMKIPQKFPEFRLEIAIPIK